MTTANKKVIVVFFKSDAGNMPVRDWLLGLPLEDRKTIGEDIKTVEFGWPVGMPVSRPLGKGLYEVRSNLTAKSIARVLFAIYKNQMVLLHGFIKKDRKTPAKDLLSARRRMKKFFKGQKGGEMKHQNIGDSFDSFLEEDGTLEQAEAVATKRVVAFQIQREMERKKLTRTMLAKKMNTSRSSLGRLLDPTNESITIKTLKRAAKSLGKKVEIRLV